MWSPERRWSMRMFCWTRLMVLSDWTTSGELVAALAQSNFWPRRWGHVVDWGHFMLIRQNPEWKNTPSKLTPDRRTILCYYFCQTTLLEDPPLVRPHLLWHLSSCKTTPLVRPPCWECHTFYNTASPWYNHIGWLAIKHKDTCNTTPLLRSPLL